MSGSTPPGTQWLQNQTQRKRRKRPTQQAASQDKTSGDQLAMDQAATDEQGMIEDVSDGPAKLGTWQWGLANTPNGWQVMGSHPNSEQYEPWGYPNNDIAGALQNLQDYRDWGQAIGQWGQ